MRTLLTTMVLIGLILFIGSCASFDQEAEYEHSVTLMTVAPGHFHAALIQKQMYPQLNPRTYVYAPDGSEVDAYLANIEQFNTRETDPTNWDPQVYRGDDYLDKALSERKGDMVMLAGNNRKKTEYIKSFVDAGYHVYSDKPMCIDRAGFELLKEAFAEAEEKDLMLYDIMTERYQINSILQRKLSQMPEVFGELRTGSPQEPSIVLESVHHFFKYVAGNPLVRPEWYFDTTQQGEGIVDVTTHLVDQSQWKGFPDEIIDYKTDVEMLSAERWPTLISLEQFQRVTQADEFPDYLKAQLNEDGKLPCYANGRIDYTLNDVHVRVEVVWDYEAPPGGDDTHYCLMRGSKSDLVILQGAEQDYKAELYVRPADGTDPDELESALESAIAEIGQIYPGVSLNRQDDQWHIYIPDEYRIGHEAHFGKVTEKYLGFLEQGQMPDWEVPNMITKYYITTSALEMAR